MKVPFLDLKAQYAALRHEVDPAIAKVIENCAFVGSRQLVPFETAFAQFCEIPHAIGVSNGTDALKLALLACGVRPGDEVVTVPNTFIGTTEAVTMIGAEVRFADVDERTMTLDPAAFEAAITRRTRAVIPVHLYGRPADMSPILEIARRHDLRVIGDAAQAHGSRYRDRPISSLGDAVCYSFYPGKNLGAYGDAGAVVTADDSIAESVRMLRDHGRLDKYEHRIEGFNCRMDGIQAAVLGVKLAHLERWTEARRKAAAMYRERLQGHEGLCLPPEDDDGDRSVYHLFVVRFAGRFALGERLQTEGVSTGVHYPIPLHRQPAYARLGLDEGSFPHAESCSNTVLSIPIFPEISEGQIDYVCDKLKQAVEMLETKLELH